MPSGHAEVELGWLGARLPALLHGLRQADTAAELGPAACQPPPPARRVESSGGPKQRLSHPAAKLSFPIYFNHFNLAILHSSP
jgi:hypothetical protein